MRNRAQRSSVVPFVAGVIVTLLAIVLIGFVIKTIFWLIKVAVIIVIIGVVVTFVARSTRRRA